VVAGETWVSDELKVKDRAIRVTPITARLIRLPNAEISRADDLDRPRAEQGQCKSKRVCRIVRSGDVERACRVGWTVLDCTALERVTCV
jgi:hypothetical protein